MDDPLVRLENKFEVMAQDVKILEANMAVLNSYRQDIVESRIRDRITIVEEAVKALKVSLEETKASVTVESARIQNQMLDSMNEVKNRFEEEASKTRRWTSYAVSLACAVIPLSIYLIHFH